MTRLTIDWSTADLDGRNTLTSPDTNFDYEVSTPSNVDSQQWALGGFAGGAQGLRASDVDDPLIATINFGKAVENVEFEIFDIDASLTGSATSGWDDQVTIIARDADGNIVDVDFSDLASHHSVDGNTVNTDGNVSPGIEASGAADSVTVNIDGPIVSLEIIYDNDGGPEISGTVGISDISFDTTPDGYVEGSSGNDTIGNGYLDDPDGDLINGGDAILSGEAPNDDIVLAGGGDDFVDGRSGDDLLFGGAGEDEIRGSGGNDIIYGDSPTNDGPIDFNSLSAGDILDQQFLESGVRISSLDDDHPVMVFDTDNPTGGDTDLATTTNGNVLILSEDGDASDPDDNVSGGTMVFDFAGPSTVNSIDFIDQAGGTVIRLYDEDGGLISTINVPTGADNTVITQNINVADVSRMEIEFQGSGAVDNLDFTLANSAVGNDDNLRGGAGDDVIFGQAGDDILRGNDGTDTLDGGAGADNIRGGDGDDTIEGGAGIDTIRGDGGADTIDGGDGADFIRGDGGADIIEGGAGADEIRGGADNDTITGGEGADTIRGGTGSDTFIGATTGDVVIGGEDNDDTDIDTLDLSGSGVRRIDFDENDAEAGVVTFLDNTTMSFSQIENVIPCFTPGTMIATPKGERKVEDLKVGDRVLTRDNGIKTINWVGTKRIDYLQLKKFPELRPIKIGVGSLGPEIPDRDMLVSPAHRMLIVSEVAQLYFDQAEVLVAAKHLLEIDGVEVSDTAYVTYIHFMCENHEIVLSDGAWSESFQPGDYSLKGMDSDQREELFALFPLLTTQEGVKAYRAARPTLRKNEASLIFKGSKDSKNSS